MKKIVSIAAALLFALSLGACSQAKGPAEAAIKAAEDALNAGKAEAMKYIPDQVKAAEDALKAAKDAFAKGDYAAATTAATSVSAKVKDFPAAAAAKAWGEASSAFQAGGLADAMAKAKSVKAKAVEIMTILGMQVPEAAKG